VLTTQSALEQRRADIGREPPGRRIPKFAPSLTLTFGQEYTIRPDVRPMREPFVNQIERGLQPHRRGELKSAARQRGALDCGRCEAAVVRGLTVCQ
jgi:hypothetical protein